MSGWYAVHDDHVTITVRLTPGASQDALGGVQVLDDGCEVLAARVRAAPEKGRANAALSALVARALGQPKSACRVMAGATGRRKILRVDGDVGEIAGRLAALTECRAGGERR